MFALYYATQYVFQSLKLMVFQVCWPHLHITILLLQMNSNPLRKVCPFFSRKGSHSGPFIISYIHTCRYACMHQRTQAPHWLSLTSWLRIWMSESFSRIGTTGSDWASGEVRNKGIRLPLWIDWHILLFSFTHTSNIFYAWKGKSSCKASGCQNTMRWNMRNIHETWNLDPIQLYNLWNVCVWVCVLPHFFFLLTHAHT